METGDLRGSGQVKGAEDKAWLAVAGRKAKELEGRLALGEVD